MSDPVIGYLGIGILFVLLAIRVPVAFAMFAVGIGGIMVLKGPIIAFNTLANEAYAVTAFLELIVIPLFVFMGALASAAGLSRNLYEAAYAWIGPIRGGLASATIVGCAVFAALSGSSVASAMTMGKVSLKEMLRYKYDARLATGVVAAGGTLGILIPPSTGLVVYAILTQQSIGQLFLAGVIPGILLSALFVLVITFAAIMIPGLGPPGPPTNWRRKLTTFWNASPMLLIILVTIGGIYGGIFTAVEASAVGAFLTLLVALARRSLNWAIFRDVLDQTVRTTAVVFLILVAAHILSPFLAWSHIPTQFGDWLNGMQLGKYGALAVILLMFVILGTFMDGFSMMVLTLPIVYPIITKLGFDPIWFGILLVITLEMGLISPPVGVNVFVVKSIAPEIPMGQMFLGIIPFWLAMGFFLIVLVVLPDLVTFLPSTMIR